MRKKATLPMVWLLIGSAITYFDFLTGPHFQFAYLFILPVGLASWHNGRRMGLLFSFAMPTLQTIYFFRSWSREFETVAISANLAMQIAVFTVISELVHRVASTRRLRTQILKSIPVGMWVLDRHGKLMEANPEGLAIWGGDPLRKPEEGIGPRMWRHGTQDNIREEERPVLQALRQGVTTRDALYEIEPRAGVRRIIQTSAVPVRNERGRIEGAVVVNQDITEAKQLEKEREEMIRSLEEARRNIKILSGLLPICASCKKIRDTGGSWQQMEQYIRSHSEAEFSHGICPECMKRDYPEYSDR